jgi:D-tyrosyl-tRNA(Tyr) deacylase
MRAVVQRVREAAVEIEGRTVGAIGVGLLVFVGVGQGDGADDVHYVAGKIRDLRIFDDEQGRMNRSVGEAGGAVLVVSQFTLCADARKGRRPSFDAAAAPAEARGRYEEVVRELRAGGLRVETGEFQALMHVRLVNDGPVTILLDSRRGF